MKIAEAIVKKVLNGLYIEKASEYFNESYMANVKFKGQRVDVEFGRFIGTERYIVVRVLYGYYSEDGRETRSGESWEEFKFDIIDPNSIQNAREKVLQLRRDAT